MQTKEYRADIAVIGGGLGGVAGALAALQQGYSVVLSEKTPWLGGQMTSQGVPPDEHPGIERFGCTRSYRRLRDGIRAYYRDWYPLIPEAFRNPALNPGNGGVSRLCAEPAVAAAVLEAMLQPFIGAGNLTLLRPHRVVAAATRGDRVESVTLENCQTRERSEVQAAYFLDATETGELLPLAGVEYVIGAEAARDTGEPHAPDTYQPLNQQAITHCFAMSHHPGEDHTISRPEQYERWRAYRPAFWTGPLLDWMDIHPVTLEPRRRALFPHEAAAGAGSLWTYRRIRDAKQFSGGAGDADITLVNWPQNDYWERPLVEVDDCSAAEARAEARQLSLALLYWLQTEAPRPDGGTGYPGLRLRGDLFPGGDGLAYYPYIRESRRVKAEFTVLEQHVARDLRPAAEPFFDSVGIGYYRIDLHPSTGGDNYIDIGCCPFQIPLGALLPVRVENLLPAAKNPGTTHITNGCFRLHPVEWNIGEVAGHLAAWSLRHGQPPRAARSNPDALSELQTHLVNCGVELEWPNPWGW